MHGPPPRRPPSSHTRPTEKRPQPTCCFIHSVYFLACTAKDHSFCSTRSFTFTNSTCVDEGGGAPSN